MAWPRPWGRDQGHEAVYKAWGRGQVRGGVAKTLGAWTRPWGGGQGRGGVAKAVRANTYHNPNSNPNAVGA